MSYEGNFKMNNFIGQLKKIVSTVKISRLLKEKIVVSVSLLYPLLLSAASDKNIEIESFTQKIKNRSSIYSVFLKNDKLKTQEYTRADLSEKYCKNITNHYTLQRVISIKPLIVECGAAKEVNNIIITNGIDSQLVKLYDKLYLHLEDSDLKIPENVKSTAFEIENKYCKKFNLKLRKILKSDPMKVVCGYPDSAKISYFTNGEWFYAYKNDDYRIIGQSEQYLIRGDYSLVDKKTGKTDEYAIKIKNDRGSYKKLETIGVATISKNKRLFVSQLHDERNDSIAEVDKNGKITKLQDYNFKFSFTFKETRVSDMRSSDDGNYLYVLIEKTQRGPGDLIFNIIDVKSKSIIFKKTLESNESGLANIYFSKQQDYILFIYRNNYTLNTFKITHNRNREK